MGVNFFSDNYLLIWKPRPPLRPLFLKSRSPSLKSILINYNDLSLLLLVMNVWAGFVSVSSYLFSNVEQRPWLAKFFFSFFFWYTWRPRVLCLRKKSLLHTRLSSVRDLHHVSFTFILHSSFLLVGRRWLHL